MEQNRIQIGSRNGLPDSSISSYSKYKYISWDFETFEGQQNIYQFKFIQFPYTETQEEMQRILLLELQKIGEEERFQQILNETPTAILRQRRIQDYDEENDIED